MGPGIIFYSRTAPPIFTDAGKGSKRSWLFLFTRLLKSLMLISKFGLRDFDNYGSSIYFSLFFKPMVF
jgi:hypothetical protein